MPRSYPRRPRTRRRAFKRYRRRPRLTNLWPNTKLVKFRIAQTAAYTGTNGAIGPQAIKANSLNDPTGGAGTNLPLGLDQWAGLYQKYKVLGSKLTLVAHPTVITGAGLIGLHLNSSSTPPATDHDHYRELPHTVMRMVSPDIDITKLSMSYSVKKYPYHIRNLKDADDQEGTFTTTPGDPADIAYYHLFVQDANKTDTVTFEIQAVIEYTVLLYDPVRPVRSTL